MTESVTWLASLSNTASDCELHAAGHDVVFASISLASFTFFTNRSILCTVNTCAMMWLTLVMFICCIRAIVLFSFIGIDHAVIISMNINLFGYARGGGGGGKCPPLPQ